MLGGTKKGSRWLCASALILVTGCSGLIGGLGGSESDGTLEDPSAVSAATDQLSRLTHTQWRNSVRSVLRWDDPPAISFEPDKFTAHSFVSDQSQLVLSSTLHRQYQDAAELLSDGVVNSGALQKIFEGANGDESAQSSFAIRGMLERAFRRPPSNEEMADYEAVYKSAATDSSADARRKQGIRAVSYVLLQSPFFLYRVELGDDSTKAGKPPAGRVNLSDWEYASRVSYTLLDAPPDEALREQVRAGKFSTPEQRRDVVTTMAKDPRAIAAFASFLRTLYSIDSYSTIDKATSIYDGPNYAADAEREGMMFVTSVLESNGGLSELLTARKSFINPRLGKLYGVATSWADNEFRQVELPENRPGIFTRIGWTAAKADRIERNSVIRGVSFVDAVTCEQMGIPNQDAFAQAQGRLKDKPNDLVTNRQLVTYTTEWGGCKSCHAEVINPKGFAFENYDAVGRWVTTDKGKPVDASGVLKLDGQNVNFSSIVDLLPRIVASEQAHGCFASNALNFLAGKRISKPFSALTSSVGARSLKERMAVRDIFIELLLSSAMQTIERPRAGGAS